MCGNCCRGDGFVVLTETDIQGLADRLELKREDFLETYARWEASMRRWVLLDQEDEHRSCIFLEPDQSCSVHEDKPVQCREFPFKWRSSNIAEYCEGWRAMVGLPPADKKTMSVE
jgi:Fe-S-cluster containining protein